MASVAPDLGLGALQKSPFDFKVSNGRLLSDPFSQFLPVVCVLRPTQAILSMYVHAQSCKKVQSCLLPPAF